jgi:dCTP deaminase
MLLSDTEIVQSVEQGRIQMQPPLDRRQLRPVGVRVHLGPTVLVPKPNQLVDLARPHELGYDRFNLSEGAYILEPSSFVLASTIERIHTASDLLCILEGRSTIARLGISIHNAASVLDGTHDAWLTPVLEISNHGNMRVVLRTGIPIGMVCFHRLQTPVSNTTSHNQYANQYDTTAPVLHLGASIWGQRDGLELADAEAVRDSFLYEA